MNKNSRKTCVDITQTTQILGSHERIALFCHTNPDADTIGSAVALCIGLRKLNKICEIFCDELPDKKTAQFAVSGYEVSTEFFGEYDLLVSIDCGDVFRMGKLSRVFDSYDKTLNIDHHGDEVYARYNCIYDYSSTAEIIYEILQQLHIALDKDIATSLFIGLSVDTGNFSHPNTNDNTFRVAQDLCKYDVPIPRINRVMYKSITMGRTKLIGKMLSRIRSYYDGKMCLVYLTRADLKEFGCTKEDAINIVVYAINVDTCIVAVSLLEHADNVYKVSVRGKEFYIKDVCERFGGGGHNFAGGCQISGFFEDVVDKLVRVVGEKLEC